MRKIGANYIFPGFGKVLKNSYLTIDDSGVVVDINDTNGQLIEQEQLEFYNGIIIPGFINTHCHIELSHLHKEIQQGNGLADFISQISMIRKADNNHILDAIKKADQFMWQSGIVAVGDIVNNNKSVDIKLSSKIEYHNFVEVFGADRGKAEHLFKRSQELLTQFRESNLSASIVPHAPYSLSDELFAMVLQLTSKENGVVTMHNQECQDENRLFIDKTGGIADFLKSIGIDLSDDRITGINSLPSVLKYLSPSNKTILVHNTYTKEPDVENACNHFESGKLFWCLCPKANLYIENKLPDIPMLIGNGQSLCIGTDSLAANNNLSILDELKTISNSFPEIPLTELLKWATYNGAIALNIQNRYGSIEPGKQPGIMLIENADLLKMTLKTNSSIRHIA